MSIKKTKKTRNKSSKNMSQMNFNTVQVDLSEVNNKKLQRALIFQGGGSLGAYEAGVFAVLYNWVKKDINDDENIFDIIGGTSVGAINASIIISHFYENKKKDTVNAGEEENTLKYWEGSPEKLLRFWKTISSRNIFYDSVFSLLKNNWDIGKKIAAQMFPFYKDFINTIASGESLRRYYSTKKMIVEGESHVFRPLFYPPFPTPLFNKFFDYSQSAWWYQYSSQPLKEFILDFAPTLENGVHHKEVGVRAGEKEKEEMVKEPRFLLVAANIETAKPETFDSYESDITIDHVLASAAIPINYPYTEIGEKKYWDGGILSNTPIRELISSHTKFWTKEYNDKLRDFKDGLTFDKWEEFYKFQKENDNTIPNLSLYVVNLFPESEDKNQIPSLSDFDMTKDREIDIRFHDITDYDIKLAQNISDYHSFVENMTQLAREAIKEIKDKQTKVDELKAKFKQIINTEQRTLTREEEPRYFYDLISKRFDIKNVLKIQRKDDEHTISGKIYDFSSQTILNLINSGIRDALIQVISEFSTEFSKDIDKKEDTIKNLDYKIGAEFNTLLNEMKNNLINQNNDNLISPELISRFREKIDKYNTQLSDKQSDTLSKSIKAIELSLQHTV
jgi:predicted acylesterase/phospholipase RssA